MLLLCRVIITSTVYALLCCVFYISLALYLHWLLLHLWCGIMCFFLFIVVCVGQTGRKFSTHYKEHKTTFRNNSNTSSFAKHLIQEAHSFSPISNVMQIVHCHRKEAHLNTPPSTFQDNMGFIWLPTPHAVQPTTLSHAAGNLQPQPGLHRKRLSNADNTDNRQYFSLVLVYMVWQKRQWTMDTVGPRCAIWKLYILPIAS
jgi:hypothetical protein